MIKKEDNKIGRPGKKLYALVDLGGTKTLLVVADEKRKTLFRENIATVKPSRPAAVFEQIAMLLERASLKLGLKEGSYFEALGICVAGFVEAKNGTVHQAPNLGWQEPVALKKMLEERLKLRVMVENDTNAAVVGEVYFGAAQGHLDAIYLTISTGIGGGLFLGGKLYRGSTGFAGEIGHIKPFGKGRECKCGGKDCLEAWASGIAIARAAENLIDVEKYGPGKIKLDTKTVFSEAKEGNSLAAAITAVAAQKTGLAISNLVNLLNPSCLVIGGGVASHQPSYLEEIKAFVYKNAIRPSVEISTLAIVPAALEPEAGIWGMHALLTGQAV